MNVSEFNEAVHKNEMYIIKHSMCCCYRKIISNGEGDVAQHEAEMVYI